MEGPHEHNWKYTNEVKSVIVQSATRATKINMVVLRFCDRCLQYEEVILDKME
jgi:hypothetical protein